MLRKLRGGLTWKATKFKLILFVLAFCINTIKSDDVIEDLSGENKIHNDSVRIGHKTADSSSELHDLNLKDEKLDKNTINSGNLYPLSIASEAIVRNVIKNITNPGHGDEDLENDRSDNETEFSSTTEDDFLTTTECVGLVIYCNYSLEQYVDMMDEYIFPKDFEWVLIVSHAMVFIVGLVGNALVCAAVYRNHSMRTVTNYFIVNLALADFMVILICLPPTVLWDVTETWFFGNTMCRLVLYFQSMSVTVSVLTLTFISVDRWYAICFPLRFKSTTTRAKKAIIIIWCISFLFNIPECVVLETRRSSIIRFDLIYLTQCTATWSTESDLNWHIVQALVLYLIPLVLMTIAYCQIVRVLWKSDNIPGHSESQNYALTTNTRCHRLSTSRRNAQGLHANANVTTEGQLRSRRKAAKMLVAVVIMFAVCYFPVHLISVLRYAFKVKQTDSMTFLALLSHWLCYANSAVNPLIYNFMSGKFRREFRRSFIKCPCFGPRGAGAGGPPARPVGRAAAAGSYRLTRLSPSDCRRPPHHFSQDNNNRKARNLSISDSATTRLTIGSELETRQ